MIYGMQPSWQTKCFLLRSVVSVTIKSKIRYNGREYASPADLPPEARAAYEKALHDGAVVKKRFSINGQSFTSEEEMPADVRRLCDDVMSVIENNGEVTIPNGNQSEPLLSKREVAVVGVFALGIVALVVARLVWG